MCLITTDLKIFKQKILQKVNKAYLGRKITMESADLEITSSLRSRNNVNNINLQAWGEKQTHELQCFGRRIRLDSYDYRDQNYHQ